MWYVLDVPRPALPGRSPPGPVRSGCPRPRLRDQPGPWSSAATSPGGLAWITVAEGSQGPRSYLFSAQRVRPTSRRKPGEIPGPSTAGTGTAANPATTCPMLRRIPRWRPWHVGGSRWRIETEFETEKSDVGLDEYETRTWALASPRGPVPAGRSFSAEPGLKKMPRITRPQVYGWCGKCCPGNGSGQPSCCGGLRIRRTVTNGPNAPMPSAAPPCGHHPTSLPELTL